MLAVVRAVLVMCADIQGAFDLAGQFLDVDRPRNYPCLLLVEEPFLYDREREVGHTYPLALPPHSGKTLLVAPVGKVRGDQEQVHSLHQVIRWARLGGFHPPELVAFSLQKQQDGPTYHSVGAENGYCGFLFLTDGPYTSRSGDLNVQLCPFSGGPDKNIREGRSSFLRVRPSLPRILGPPYLESYLAPARLDKLTY